MRRRTPVGGCCAAFGIGLLLATILPSKMILILAAIALVALGCTHVIK